MVQDITSSSSLGASTDWSVAVAMSFLHYPRSSASRLAAQFKPWFSGWRSASMVLSQVWHGQPGWRFLGGPYGSLWIDVCRALNISSESPILAMCPKKRSHLVWMSGSSCRGEPATSRTSAFVTWSVYRIWSIHRRQMLSKAVVLSVFQGSCQGPSFETIKEDRLDVKL